MLKPETIEMNNKILKALEDLNATADKDGFADKESLLQQTGLDETKLLTGLIILEVTRKVRQRDKKWQKN